MRKFYVPVFILIGIMSKAQSFVETTPTAFKNYFYSAAAVADFDNDGYQDVFFTGAIDSNDDTEVDLTYNEFYKNNQGVFSAFQTFGDKSVHTSAVKFLDFDNDGLLDVVTTGLSYGDIVNYQQYIWRNTGSEFVLVDNIPGKIYGGIEVFDFNHDGKQDYAINGTQYVEGIGFTHAIDLYTNQTNGFNLNEALVDGTQNGSFKIIDINNDNELDVIVNGYNADLDPVFNVYINQNGVFTLSSQLPAVANSKMAYADFNGDGFLDFVVAGQDENYDTYLGVFINDGQGNFTENKIDGEGLSDGAIETGDVNNDGYYDFVVIGDDDYESYTKVFLYNPQLQKFEKEENSGVHNLGSMGTLALFDYDNDGNLDILANGFDWSDPDYLPYTKLFRNNTTVSNQKPNAPTILNTTIDGEKVKFDWSGATDDKTPVNSLQYELSVGTEAGKADVAKYVITNNSWYLNVADLPSKIFWSVKAIDAAKKYSDKSEEKELALLSVSNFTKESIAVYPNPVTDLLNVKTSSKIKEIKIYNISGQVVTSAKTISEKSIDVSKLEKGIYIIDVLLENGKKLNQKIIKK